MAPSVDILLATYNGARYLPELLASLEAQEGAGFQVLVRDDGSRDETLAILTAWAARLPGRVVLLPTDQPTGSAARNFDRLMQASTADYVLFADQDDVWHPNKVAVTVAALRAGEQEIGGADRPVLAFCDLALIDGAGGKLQDSFRAFQRLDAQAGVRLQRLLLNNVVTGCAMGVNRTALALCGPLPEAAVMHDWWLALLCAGRGTIKVMPECLIDYRQHDGNVVGARADTVFDALPGLRRLSAIAANVSAYRAWLGTLYRQAAAFETQHGAALPPNLRTVVAAFAGLAGQGALARRWMALWYGFRLESRVQTLGFLARM